MTIHTPTSHAKPTRKWPWVLLGMVLAPCLAFLVFAVFAVSASHAPSVAPTVGAVPTVPMPIVAPQAPPTKVIHGIVNGNEYKVGRDVPAGRYHTDGSHDGAAPYATVTDGNGQIIKVINVDGPSNITLEDGQVFSTHGGVVWEYMEKGNQS